jgi:hypothetical protein
LAEEFLQQAAKVTVEPDFFTALRLGVHQTFGQFVRMNYRTLGRTGWKVSEISFGARAIGGRTGASSWTVPSSIMSK